MLRNLIFVLLFSTLTANAQSNVTISKSSKSVPEIPTVGFCEVIRHPELYNGKQIRIQAMWLPTFVWSWLYADSSNSCDGYKDLNFIKLLDCPNDESCMEMQDTLNNGDSFDGNRLELVIVGRFEDEAPFSRRNGAFRFKLWVSRVEKVMRIPPNALMSWERHERMKL